MLDMASELPAEGLLGGCAVFSRFWNASSLITPRATWLFGVTSAQHPSMAKHATRLARLQQHEPKCQVANVRDTAPSEQAGSHVDSEKG